MFGVNGNHAVVVEVAGDQSVLGVARSIHQNANASMRRVKVPIITMNKQTNMTLIGAVTYDCKTIAAF